MRKKGTGKKSKNYCIRFDLELAKIINRQENKSNFINEMVWKGLLYDNEETEKRTI